MSEDAEVALVDATLRKAGWIGALDAFAGSDVEVAGVGEAALQFPNQEKGALLRLEYHLEGPDGVREIHFHVADENDAGGDFVLRHRGNLPDVLAEIVRLQRELTVDTTYDLLPSIAELCAEAYVVVDQRLRSFKAL